MNPELVAREVARNLADGPYIRLFHGRGKTFPGWSEVNLDLYGDTAVFQLFEPEAEPAVRTLVEPLQQVFAAAQQPLRALVLQRRFLRDQDAWEVLYGALPEEVAACEGDLRFHVELMRKQNVGFFADMRLGRCKVRELAAGGKVLNLFAYTCSVSAAAVAGGAASVVNMDVSKAALKVGRRNHLLNDQDPRTVDFFSFDVMRSFGRMKQRGPYRVVFLDPPTFQRGRFDARSDYARIVRRLPEMLEPGGYVLGCLNAPHLGRDFLTECFDQTPELQLVEWLGRPPECPELDDDASLKIGVYQYRPEAGVGEA